MIKSLQSLRALGALMIFVHHFANDAGVANPVLHAFGDGPVTWFFMLSGFVLCLAFSNRYEAEISAGRRLAPADVWHFILPRYKRLAPLYYIGMVLMLILWIVTDRWVIRKALLASALMVQSWVPDMYYFFSFHRPAWFVSDIMFCYLLFLPLLWVMVRYRYGWLWLMLPVLLAYFTVVMLYGDTPEKVMRLYIFYVLPPMRLPAFMSGMVLWRLTGRLRGVEIKPVVANALIVLTVAVTVGWFAGAGRLPECISMSSYWWPVTALILVVLTLTDGVDCRATRLLHWHGLVSLGNASMAFYLLHRPLLSYWEWLTDMTGVKIPAAVSLPLEMALMIVIALWIHRRFYPRRV